MTLKIEADTNLKEAVTQKVRAETQQSEAERQRLLAEEERKRAEQQTVVAGQQRERAEEQTKLTEQEKVIAESQRRLAQEEGAEALRQKAQADAARGARGRSPPRKRAREDRRDAAARARRHPPRPVGGSGSRGAPPSPARRRPGARDPDHAHDVAGPARRWRRCSRSRPTRSTRRTAASPRIRRSSTRCDPASRASDPKTVAALKTLPDAVHAVRSAPDSGSSRPAATTAACGSPICPARDARAPDRLGRQRDPRPRLGRWRQAAGRRNARRPRPAARSVRGHAVARSSRVPAGVTAFAVNSRGNLLAVATASGDVRCDPLCAAAVRRRGAAQERRHEADLLAGRFFPTAGWSGPAEAAAPSSGIPSVADDAPRKVLGERRSARSRWRPDGRLAAGTEDGRSCSCRRASRDRPPS